MREKFPSYYPLADNDFQELWISGTIVLDANVLLHLHRYSPSSRDNLLRVLEKFKDRLWVPHMYALDYHENLASVIADCQSVDQKTFSEVSSKFLEVITLIKDKKDRHQRLKPDQMIEQLENLLDQWKKVLPPEFSVSKIFNDEKLFLDLDRIFANKIGEAYGNSRLQELYKIGEERFKKELPPGFRDAKKKSQTFHNSVVYEKQFSDFIGWQQTLEHAKANNIKYLMIVSDDDKNDWWASVKGQKNSPRRELIEEALEYGIKVFWLYNTGQFLSYANEQIDVTKETIQEAHKLRLSLQPTTMDHRALSKLISEISSLKALVFELHELATLSQEPEETRGLSQVIEETIFGLNHLGHRLRRIGLHRKWTAQKMMSIKGLIKELRWAEETEQLEHLDDWCQSSASEFLADLDDSLALLHREVFR